MTKGEMVQFVRFVCSANSAKTYYRLVLPRSLSYRKATTTTPKKARYLTISPLQQPSCLSELSTKKRYLREVYVIIIAFVILTLEGLFVPNMRTSCVSMGVPPFQGHRANENAKNKNCIPDALSNSFKDKLWCEDCESH